ncbi:MAG: asparagine synthetase B family protein [Bryobacteraceae bacterium]
MGAQAGLCKWGIRVEEAMQDRISTVCTSIGSNDRRVAHGPVRLEFHTRDRDASETLQPFAGSDGRVITWDGRLDNRTEILHGAEPPRGRASSDVELVHAAFAKWGTAFLEKLTGDFALALWDPSTWTVYLARDPFGTRPLFYWCFSEGAAWSTEIAALVKDNGAIFDLDDEYVAGYLLTSEDWERTPYRGVRCVPPGHSVMMRPSGVTVHRWWTPEHTPELQYQSDEEYEEQFLELFRNSVANRLRGHRTVVAELSGGLDSSSIVCAANDLLGKSNVDRTALKPVCYTYDRSATSDESRYMKLIEEHTGLAAHYLSDSRILAPAPEEIPRWMPSPLALFPETFRGLKELLRICETTTLLSGAGGDQMMMHDGLPPAQLADMLRRVQLGRLARELKTWSGKGHRSWLELLLQGAIWPLLPLSARRSWRPRTRQLPGWLDPEFALRTSCAERIVQHERTVRLSTYAAEKQYDLVLDAASLVASCPYRELTGADATYPYLDRRLVEFLMRTPAAQKLRPGESRSLHRRSVRGILPNGIRQRVGKRGPDESLGRAFCRDTGVAQLLGSDAFVSKRGYACKDRLSEMIQRVRHGVLDQLQPLVKLLSLEVWLRAREDRVPGRARQSAAWDDS